MAQGFAPAQQQPATFQGSHEAAQLIRAAARAFPSRPGVQWPHAQAVYMNAIDPEPAASVTLQTRGGPYMKRSESV